MDFSPYRDQLPHWILDQSQDQHLVRCFKSLSLEPPKLDFWPGLDHFIRLNGNLRVAYLGQSAIFPPMACQKLVRNPTCFKLDLDALVFSPSLAGTFLDISRGYGYFGRRIDWTDLFQDAMGFPFDDALFVLDFICHAIECIYMVE
jgi:hypothetical protein